MSFSLTSRAVPLLGAAVLALAPVSNSAPVSPKPALSEPSLSPDRKEIAFVSGGDIWTVPASGGEAHLLIAHPAYDSRPLYSPDGTQLAFMSTRTGNGDIYVLSLATGALRRVTFDDVPEQLDAWSRDGTWLYFSSGSKDVNGMDDIYRVRAAGGTPMPVAADRFAQEYWSTPSPTDPNTIAITGTGRTVTDWWRHGHSHIDESQIWLVHVGGATPTYDDVTADAARDAWPMWSSDGRALYYVSDKSGADNLWTKPASGGAAHALTSFRDSRVLWPQISYDGRQIVFERNFAVWTADPATGKAAEVPITLRGASTAQGATHETLTSGFQWLALSPDGKKIAFTAHGDVFAASARDGGDAARVTATPELEAEIAWAPDSKRIVYVSERDSVAHLFLYDFSTNTETRLTDGPLNDISPVWSPDGKSLAYMHGDKQLHVLDVATKQDRQIATGELDRPPRLPDHAIAWSPDGKYLAFLTRGFDGFQNPEVVAVAGGPARPVSFLANAFGATVAWSPDGTYLLFDTSQRTESPQIARVDLVPRTPRFREDQFRDLFTQPSRPGTPAEPGTVRVPPRRDTTTVRADSSRAAHRAETRIVFDDIRRRLSFLPLGVDARSVAISPDGKTALLTASAAGQTNLYTFSLDELSAQRPVARQLTSTPGFKGQAQWSPDGKDVWYIENGRINAINVESRQAHPLNVTAEMDVDFSTEKMAVFHQAWRILADNFFNPTMNGVDWNAVEREYAPYAAGAQSTEDLRRIMRLMVGELNASHSGVNGPSYSPQANVGKLGVRFDRATYEKLGALRVSDVLDLSPAQLAGIKPGDYILAVDGARAGEPVNLDSLLLYTADKRVTLTVSAALTGAPTRDVAIRPVNLATERGLIYRDWVESRRAYVDSISHGKLGYVHMQDMSDNALHQLYVDLDVQNREKEGVVIDIRNNNGGFVNPYAIDVLSRRGYLLFTPRDFTTASGRSTVGQRALEKPTVLVTNMHSLSDAEDFTEGYRALKLGPVVGDSTAGWIIFTSDVGLLDGTSSVRMPFERITDASGKDMELHPRPVDVYVKRPLGESYTGHDSQLDAAVAALFKRLGTTSSAGGTR
ncbi:MAG TPA: DPP IV N-terminal domain-containing protein [Gemmatimonadaceae bacterium]|nr:DPP IV N-terminal domain-containing protein [Gemmatimonadaceae bacterium]